MHPFTAKLLASLALLSTVGAASAQMSPVGLWRTVDDKTGEAMAEIRISAKPSGALSGVVERPLVTANRDPLCTPCTDDRKGKPKIGMEVIRDARQTEGKTEWAGGTILDPETGKVYKTSMTPLDDGKKLQVRGFIGPFYRTQVWVRIQ
jgi:uncharacterized protein (DUF2147 family)